MQQFGCGVVPQQALQDLTVTLGLTSWAGV
jgi:hypothetical protein